MLSLTPVYLSFVARIGRASALDVMRTDYLRTALARGCRPRALHSPTCCSNSLLPRVTAVGSGFALLIGGTVVTETVFSIPGVGPSTGGFSPPARLSDDPGDNSDIFGALHGVRPSGWTERAI